MADQSVPMVEPPGSRVKISSAVGSGGGAGPRPRLGRRSMAEKPRIVGIDLGTTNTCVASVRNRIPKVVPTDRGNLILPSVVAVSAKGDLLVGNVAKDQMVVNPTNTIYGAKRLIGRQYNSRIVQEIKGYFTYEIVEGPKGDAAVNLGGSTYPLPQI